MADERAMFYVEAAFNACPRCGQAATHRVLRRGKAEYGLYCERHAGLEAALLNTYEFHAAARTAREG